MHVETDRASERLVNQRFAYVAVSRGQYDARISKNAEMIESTDTFDGGRNWWTHFEFTRTNIDAPSILRKIIEEL